jgi:hypothetical protein
VIDGVALLDISVEAEDHVLLYTVAKEIGAID